MPSDDARLTRWVSQQHPSLDPPPLPSRCAISKLVHASACQRASSHPNVPPGLHSSPSNPAKPAAPCAHPTRPSNQCVRPYPSASNYSPGQPLQPIPSALPCSCARQRCARARAQVRPTHQKSQSITLSIRFRIRQQAAQHENRVRSTACRTQRERCALLAAPDRT